MAREKVAHPLSGRCYVGPAAGPSPQALAYAVFRWVNGQ